MKNRIKVTVVVPVYNQEQLIIDCILSIPKRRDVEIIIVNDASTDLTKKSIKMLQNEFKDITVINFKKNKGVSAARNAGIEAARGEYIVFIDSDDKVDTDVFNEIVDKNLNNYDLVYYNMITNTKAIYFCNETNYTYRWGMFKFIKKSIIGDLRFKEGMNYAEDKDFTLRLLEKNPTRYYTNKIMYYYNFPRKGSLSAIGENR